MTVLRFVHATALVASVVLLAGIPSASAQTGAANLSGTWQLVCTNKKGKARDITLDIRQSGSALSGTYSGKRGAGRFNGNVQGARVSFTAGRFTFTGTVSGNEMNGQNQRGQSCSATRP